MTPSLPGDVADEVELAAAAHDAVLAGLAVDIWIGNEPTFTNRLSLAPEWLSAAVGDDKLDRAGQLLVALMPEGGAGVLLRTIGRQYDGEDRPRWSFGVYARRDGVPIWSGPPDPLRAGAGMAPEATTPPDLERFRAELVSALAGVGLGACALSAPGASETDGGSTRELRIVIGRCAPEALWQQASDPRLARASIHDGPIPSGGLQDQLGEQGTWLFILRDVGGVASIELPALGEVDLFLEVLRAIAEAAERAALPRLSLCGFPPPVDARVSFATVTPDPAVVELNMAPEPTVRDFLRSNRRAFAAARAVGLEPLRLQFNGMVVDSGGGGQITIGGPSPTRSPFLVQPRLLSRLVRYVVSHPALSYLFAHDYVGPCGQSVRADERGPDAFDELRLALALLGADGLSDPESAWRALAPLLTDSTGNSHRAELNVEKLWNPHLPGRGRLGLVELRGLRMQSTPERAAALAALLRAIVARLMVGSDPGELVDWGRDLHDRFALPFYLEADLAAVLADLDAAGVGLGPVLAAALEPDDFRAWSAVALPGATLTIRRALEFWPLIGDASRQQGTSRLVEASTSRLELALCGEGSGADASLDGWRIRANGVALPLRQERDGRGDVRLFGLRYRSFFPLQGMHPTLQPQLPLRLTILPPGDAQALELALHEWRPDGGAYPGLPTDLADAGARRDARCVLRPLPLWEVGPPVPAPSHALTPYCLDLRYPSPPSGARAPDPAPA